MAAFTINDAGIKFVTQSLPLGEAVAIRGCFVTLMLWVIAQRDGGIDWWPTPRRDRRILFLRTAAEIVSTLLYLVVLQHMALGDLSAILQSLPLLVMLAAALFFGERLGWRRLTAVGVGMVGVLLILRPGTGAFDIWAMGAIGAVMLIVVRDMVTRAFTPHMQSSTVAFYAALGVTLSAPLMSAGDGWRWPTGTELSVLGISTVALTVGYLTAVSTMRVGEVGFVSPFRYTGLVFAILLGLVVFGEWPDGWTWAGASLVVGAGLYSILRESRLRREAP